jgi:hypothetical protein
MKSYSLVEKATPENFSEHAYLMANPDVAIAVKNGTSASALQHFELFGLTEGRNIRLAIDSIRDVKKQKLEKIRPLLRKDLTCVEQENHCFDFLTEEIKYLYNISPTDTISSNAYEDYILEHIQSSDDLFILDCGAGHREIYYDHIVNFEIEAYDTTDVVGVGEELPFIDHCFDMILSLSVLEHVSNPFKCAKEISRVLKPGGSLICCVPFLQPFHGYPYHYYNMTSEGVKNLFSGLLHAEAIEVRPSGLPIRALSWILNEWARGLDEDARNDFLQASVSDLMKNPDLLLGKSYVKGLNHQKNSDLAYSHVLFARKPK